MIFVVQIGALARSENIRLRQNDVRRPVIVGLDHLAFIQRPPYAAARLVLVVADWPRSFITRQLGNCAELVAVVGHVKHCRIANRPDSDRLALPVIDEHRRTVIDS